MFKGNSHENSEKQNIDDSNLTHYLL